MRERQRAVRSRLADNTDAGYWRVVAYPPKRPTLDISMFRGKPVELGRFSFSDPFGPKTFTIRFPQITIFDKISEGDLVWLHKFANIDILWNGDAAAGLPVRPDHQPGPGTRSGAGRATSTSFSWDPSLTIECVGAMRQLDDYQAKPEYPVPAAAVRVGDRPAVPAEAGAAPAAAADPLAVLVDHDLHAAEQEDRAVHGPGRGDQGQEVDRAADPLDRRPGSRR